MEAGRKRNLEKGEKGEERKLLERAKIAEEALHRWLLVPA